MTKQSGLVGNLQSVREVSQRWDHGNFMKAGKEPGHSNGRRQEREDGEPVAGTSPVCSGDRQRMVTQGGSRSSLWPCWTGTGRSVRTRAHSDALLPPPRKSCYKEKVSGTRQRLVTADRPGPLPCLVPDSSGDRVLGSLEGEMQVVFQPCPLPCLMASCVFLPGRAPQAQKGALREARRLCPWMLPHREGWDMGAKLPGLLTRAETIRRRVHTAGP